MLSTVSTDKRLRLGELFDGSERPDTSRQPNVPAVFVERVQAAVAGRWSVRSDIIVLAWPETEAIDVDAETAFRLVGDGTDGWFPLVIEKEGEPGTALRLRAGVSVEVPVARRSLKVGALLRRTDYSVRTVVSWRKPPAKSRPPIGPGWRVVDAVQRGNDLSRSNVIADPVIRAGDHVRLRWKRGVVTVALDGQALHDAAVGDEITVRLRGRRGEATGVVLKRGLARLDG